MCPGKVQEMLINFDFQGEGNSIENGDQFLLFSARGRTRKMEAVENTESEVCMGGVCVHVRESE